MTSDLTIRHPKIGCYHKGCTLDLCYQRIDEEAAKRAYDAFAGPRGKRTTKEKLRDAFATYEKYRSEYRDIGKELLHED